MLVVILILIVSVLLGLTVLVQNSKGGGLVSNFGGANQMMGVRQTTDFLEKATWTMAGILVVLCLISSITINRGTEKQGSQVEAITTGIDNSAAATMDDMGAGEPAAEAPAETPAE